MSDSALPARPVGLVPRRLVETHVHFWDHSVAGLEWSWLRESSGWGYEAVDCHRYDPSAFAIDATGARPHKVVHVQCADLAGALLEAKLIDAVADSSPWPDAWIGGCRLSARDGKHTVDQLAAFPRFRGIRDATPDLEALTLQSSRAALAALARHDGTCELMAPPAQVERLARIAKSRPEVTFVLGQSGSPENRTDDFFRLWSAGLTKLGHLDNVVCKISGLTRKDPDWTLASLRPWVLACVEAFGPQRCMFGGNWPPSRLTGTYLELVATYNAVLEELTPAERDAVFASTAERVYRLND